MVIKYTNLLHSKALQNLPKLGFLALKINRLATRSVPEFLGKRVPGSEFLGKRVPGSEFLGKRVPGSEFLGKRVPGSEFLGKRVPGSEFLGKRSVAYDDDDEDMSGRALKRSPEFSSGISQSDRDNYFKTSGRRR
jgi:hypothetical protein